MATRPDSRDAPHLFGLGIKEMLADEMTAALRSIRDEAVAQAAARKRPVRRRAGRQGRVVTVSSPPMPDGHVDASDVEGVDAGPAGASFFAHGDTVSIREFVVGALNAEMGLQVADPDLARGACRPAAW